MPNYVQSTYANYEKARSSLVKALDMLEKEDCGSIKAIQTMNVTDGLAQVFKEKPVVIIQNMNVKILVIKQVYTALRALDQIDKKLLCDAIETYDLIEREYDKALR